MGREVVILEGRFEAWQQRCYAGKPRFPDWALHITITAQIQTEQSSTRVPLLDEIFLTPWAGYLNYLSDTYNTDQ